MNRCRPRTTFLPCAALAAALACAPIGHAIAGGAAVPSPSARAAADTTDRLIIRYRDGTRKQPTAVRAASDLIQGEAGRSGFTPRLLRQTGQGAEVWAMDRPMTIAQAEDLARRIAAADPDVAYAEPDRRLRPMYTPNDAYFGYQWNLTDPIRGINATTAWDRADGSGVVVAVIDTGVRPHADLVGNLLPGFDLIYDAAGSNDGDGRDADASDSGDYGCGLSSDWHGTHVAGIVAATANNGNGIAGVAFGAKVLPVRVLGACHWGYTSDIADGVLWAVGEVVPLVRNRFGGTAVAAPVNPRPAKVLNLSLGGDGGCPQTFANAIATARARGAVVVVAAGNDGRDASNTQPANCPGVVAVAATDPSGGRASFSNFGAGVALAAPGVSILSTVNTGQTTPGSDSLNWYSGTSMAAPHVAGVAALMLSRNPSLTPDQVAATLRATAHAFPASCPGCGAGIVDARAAVDAAVASVAPFATVSIVPSSIFKVRIGYGTVVAPASATITNGSPPFVYRWSSAWGQLSLYNAASSTVSVSAYLEPCGGVARIDDQLVLQVTDALNRVNTVYAPVTFIADPKQGEICQ